MKTERGRLPQGVSPKMAAVIRLAPKADIAAALLLVAEDVLLTAEGYGAEAPRGEVERVARMAIADAIELDGRRPKFGRDT